MKKTLVLVLLLLPSVCYPQSTYSVVKNIERNWLTGTCWTGATRVECPGYAEPGRWVIGVGTEDPHVTTGLSTGALHWRSDTRTLKTYNSTTGTWAIATGNEGTCPDFNNNSFPICTALPTGPSYEQSSLTYGDWNTSEPDAFSMYSLKLANRPSGFLYPSYQGIVNRIRITAPITATQNSSTYAFYGEVSEAGSGTTTTGSSYLSGGAFYSTNRSTGIRTSVYGTEGVASGLGSIAGQIFETLVGVFGSASPMTATATVNSFSTGVLAGGPSNIAWVGTDVTKVYKLMTSNTYGRNYFQQPADTYGDATFSAEFAKGKGVLVSGRAGQLQLEKASGGAKPTCNSTTRGSIWYEPGGAGVADTWEKCHKNAGDAYAWTAF